MKKWLLGFMATGLLAGMLMPCLAAQPDVSGGKGGFGPALCLTFSDESYSSGSEAYATITVCSISAEQSTDGIITICGPDGVAPVEVPLQSDDQVTVQVPLPTEQGNYTYTATLTTGDETALSSEPVTISCE